MQLREALLLIRHQKFTQGSPQRWADLGCSTGFFTIGLAEILPEGSDILAIDKSKSSLDNMPGSHRGGYHPHPARGFY